MRRLFYPAMLALFLVSCGIGVDESAIESSSEYVIFAWNDLGMHCLNPTYDTAVILPPYNTLWAQVVKRGSRPEIVTDGIEVDYKILSNSYSYGKRSYGQFWDNCVKLFGVELEHNTGLNLEDPDIHNSLSGKMVGKGDHFVANGIPVTPVEDSNIWNPYQIAEITVLNSAGEIIAKTQATVPTSDEINCARCHGDKPFQDILEKHDKSSGSNLVEDKPVLCASCHGSPALGIMEKGKSGKYLSEAIHGYHASRGAECLDCHPGATTKCSRSIKHTASDGNCKTCHGDMSEVANTVKAGTRIPWVNEPNCSRCHTSTAQVDTGNVLYRNANGHGSLYCPSCHGSPHAMVPSREDSDNYQAMQYQGKAKTLGSCGVCHSNSRGKDDIGDFAEVHAGAKNEKNNACHICHTAITTETSKWPHAYQWKGRS